MSRRDLTDQEWAAVQPPLPNRPRGVQWRDLPEDCGHCATVFNSWFEKGTGYAFSMP